MKIGLCFALSLVVLSPVSANAAPKRLMQKTARRTVLAYFRLLPARFFEIPDRRVLLQKSRVPLIDAAHDYLRTGGDGAQPSLEVAVFRYHGLDTVAIASSYGKGYGFALLRLEKGHWRDVTLDLSPVVPRSGLRFVLPRYGTTIAVFEADGRRLTNLFWDKGMFFAEVMKR